MADCGMIKRKRKSQENLRQNERKAEMTQTTDAKKHFILQQLRNSEEMFVLYSKCTRMPYVHCDEESYNDQIYLYRKEEDAVNAIKELEKERIPVQALKFLNESFLNFYSGLYFMGINALVVDKGTDEEIEVLLSELVTEPDYSQMPEGKVRVDNPQFQLTAMYLMQKLRREPGVQPDEEMKELEEELIVNVRRGTYIVPVQEDKQVPLMKLAEEDLFQPIFTDVHEFQKFNPKKEFKALVVPYENIAKIVVEQAKGIIINPLGVHVVMMKEQLK